jgi:NAD(P)-dependent dehydrogenase (short-subunit alcohol dehydrogenase family)
MSARVLVTGAAGGIGAATVAELRSRGARVVGLDLRADADGKIIVCDVRDQGAVERALAEVVERLGGLDVEISVTTVYPGYIRTPIHDAARHSGVGLEGAVPAERLEDAARTLARAALDPDPPRDLATSRRGAFNYALLRLAPRRLMDRLIGGAVRRLARRGGRAESGLAGELVKRGQTP